MCAESRNLDVLRAFAVLCVYFSHLLSTILGITDLGIITAGGLGNIGVLLFFVHTSLVLMMSLERTRPAGLFATFYIRRAFRIYPLSIFCVALVVLLGIPATPSDPYRWVGWPSLLSNLALTMNITQSPTVTGPLWSLPWEVQMYVLLPFMYVFLEKRRSVLPVFAMWAAAVFLSCLGMIEPFKPLRLLQFVPCFLGGVLAYQAGKRVRARVPARAFPVLLAVAVAARGALWFGHGADRANNLAGNLICLGAGFAIPWIREIPKSWFTGTCHSIAKYSYGIYLFHVPVMWFAFVRLSGVPAAGQYAVLLALSVLCPWLAYHVIEERLIRAGRSLATATGGRPVRFLPEFERPGVR